MLSQNLTGRILRSPDRPAKEALDLIYKLPNPPLTKLRLSDVYIARCQLLSSSVDSRFGCFRDSDLPRLHMMLQGIPIVIGRENALRCDAKLFGGEIKQEGEHSHLELDLFWPRVHSAARDTMKLIQAGIYLTVHIAFRYETPTCSICAKDIRACAHWPGREYSDALCFFYYDGVEEFYTSSHSLGTGFEVGTHNETEGE